MRGRLPVLLLAVLCLGFVTGCDDDNNNIDLGGLDCGLIRDDLFGDWSVSYTVGGSRNLTNCSGDDPSVEGASIDVSNTPVLYTGTDVFGNTTSPSFRVIADRIDGGNDVSVSDEFRLNIGADSCQSFFWLWEADDATYVQCIGTFSVGSGTLLASCDSAEVDTDADDAPDTSCSLSTPFDVSLSVD